MHARKLNVQPQLAFDTAGAAMEVAALGNPSVAAVASRRAAKQYGLVVLADGIETSKDKIESRPSRAAAWDYVFYLDFEGDPCVTPGREALALMRTCCQWVQVLGTYLAAATVLERISRTPVARVTRAPRWRR